MTDRKLNTPQRLRTLLVLVFLQSIIILLLGTEVHIAVAQEGTPGTPWTGARGISESTAQIMSRQQSEDAQPKPAQSGPRQLKPRLLGNPNKQPSPNALPSLPAASGINPSPLSPQTIGLNWTGATLSGVNPSLTFPPDTMGAAGPTQYIVAANGRIVSFVKSTGTADGVLNVTTDVFFTTVRNGASTTDPRIRYDRLSGRWFITMINVARPNRLLIAVSSQSTITSASNFTFFFVPIDATTPTISSSCAADYPSLGIDVSALYMGANNFCPDNTTFDSTDAYVIRKSSVLGAGPIVVTVFRNLTGSSVGQGPFAPQGVDNYDPAATEGYVIGVSNQFFSQLVLRRISSPATTPSISANIIIGVPTTSYPISVRHQGNTGGTQGQLDALDDRLFAAHFRNGRLWTAHNIGVIDTGAASTSAANRDAARWYELQGIASPGVPSVFQSGTVYTPGSPGSVDVRNYFIPTIMVSGQGHAAMGFSTAGTFEFVNAGTVGRLAGDPLGTMQTVVLYTNSTTAYNPPGDNGSSIGARRWGDYSYTSLDPIDDMTMWTIQEWCNATDSYGLQIAQLIAPPPATPASTNQDAPTGRPVFYVDVTGTQISGSGFYDPGANPPAGPPFSHITATVTADVGVVGTPPTVNSVIYLNPTTVRLNLNTTSATANTGGQKYSVTVTNPDGQSRAGSQILLVVTPTAVTLTGLSARAGDTLLLWGAALGTLSLLLISALVVMRRR